MRLFIEDELPDSLVGLAAFLQCSHTSSALGAESGEQRWRRRTEVEMKKRNLARQRKETYIVIGVEMEKIGSKIGQEWRNSNILRQRSKTRRQRVGSVVAVQRKVKRVIRTKSNGGR